MIIWGFQSNTSVLNGNCYTRMPNPLGAAKSIMTLTLPSLFPAFGKLINCLKRNLYFHGTISYTLIGNEKLYSIKLGALDKCNRD